MSFFTEILLTALGTIAVSDGTNVMGVNTDGSINVRVLSGGGGGSNPSAGPTGSPVPADADYEGVSVGGTLQGVTGLSLGSKVAPTVAIVDGSGNQITTFGGGTQFADNAASGGTPTGTLAMGWDSVNSKIRALKVDASQNLEVAVNAPLPAGTNVIGHVIVDSFGSAIDVTDRAARLVGVVYGSQGQQIKQTPTNFNLQVELAAGGTLYDARQIRALTSADVVAVNGLSAAVVLADSLANPTTVEVGANLLGYDMANNVWRRAQVLTGTGALQTFSFVTTDGVNFSGTPTHPFIVNVEASNTPLTVTFDGSPAIAALNVHLTNALVSVVTTSDVGLDAIASPSTFMLVGGRTSDSPAEYDALPLGTEGRSVLVEGFPGVSLHTTIDNLFLSVAVVDNTLTQIGYSAAHPFVSKITDGINILGTSTNPLVTNVEASNTPLTVTFIGSPAVAALNVNVVNKESPAAYNKALELTTKAAQTLITGVNGQYVDLTHLSFSNQNAVTGVLLTVTDGVVNYQFWVPANSQGLGINFDPPLQNQTLGGPWTASISAAITGGCIVNAQAIKR